jgi:pimeloyl-ACP methyl ester carboxylesterase
VAGMQTDGVTRIVESADGTPIACWATGSGPPLVLLHGTAADRTRWRPVLPALRQQRTVYLVDRRGRGESGDADGYAIAREIEDITAVIDAIGGPVELLGHSYGGLCALESALRTRNVRRLLLYEPPLRVADELPATILAEVERLVAEGKPEQALISFMRDMVQVPPHEVELLRTQPSWPGRVAAAHTIPRELGAVLDYQFDPARFAGVHIPTLLLLGGDSPGRLKRSTEAAHAALPHSRVAVMPGQQHAAMDTGTDLFTAEVIRFLTTP